MRKTLLTTGALIALIAAPSLAQDVTPTPADPSPVPELLPAPAPGDDLTIGQDALTPSPDVATAETKFLDQQGDTHLLASNLIGATVYSAADDSLGEINDIVVNEDDNSIDAVVVGVGGFLGIGQKNVAISFDALTESFDADGNPRLVVDASIEELEAAPAFLTLADLEAQRQQQEMQQMEPGLAPAPEPMQ